MFNSSYAVDSCWVAFIAYIAQWIVVAQTVAEAATY